VFLSWGFLLQFRALFDGVAVSKYGVPDVRDEVPGGFLVLIFDSGVCGCCSVCFLFCCFGCV
jgi:hypothetical protein